MHQLYLDECNVIAQRNMNILSMKDAPLFNIEVPYWLETSINGLHFTSPTHVFK